MKANELMIGDWVNLTYTDRFTKEIVSKNFQVVQMRDDYGVLCAWAKGKMCDHNMDAIEKLKPIALTPEILEKNGFEKRYAIGHWEWVLFNERFSISIEEWLEAPSEHNYVLKYERTDILEPIIQLTLSYVHELQRAFRICGEYELADNFKL